MIVRQLKNAEQENRSVKTEHWTSHRLILKADQAGFSFHITEIKKGAVLDMEYKNHIESVYCIAGRGEILDKATNKVYGIEPGTVYLLDQHDKHRLIAHENMQFACVFNPPVVGQEVHDENGAYPASDAA